MRLIKILLFAGNGPSNIHTLMKYMLPVMLFSIVFNLPKFFEIRMDETEFFNNQTNTTHIEFKLNPTELRLDDNYVFYYVNIARFVVSGLIPLITLTFLHMAIYRYRPLLITTTV